MSLRSTMFESTAVGRRATIGRGTAGGKTQDPFVVILGTTQPGGNVVGVPCSVQEANASIKMLYSQRNTVVDTTIIFDIDPVVEANDRLEVKDRTGNLAYYLVVGKAQPVGRARLWQVTAIGIHSPT